MAAVPVQMDVEEEEKGAQKSEIDELKKKIKDLEAKAEEKETAWSKADEEAREMPDDDPKRTAESVRTNCSRCGRPPSGLSRVQKSFSTF